MTLEQLQAKRESLIGALAAPKEVQLPDGSRVVQGDTAGLQAAIAAIDTEIARLQAPGASRVFTVQSSRGLK